MSRNVHPYLKWIGIKVMKYSHCLELILLGTFIYFLFFDNIFLLTCLPINKYAKDLKTMKHRQDGKDFIKKKKNNKIRNYKSMIILDGRIIFHKAPI